MCWNKRQIESCFVDGIGFNRLGILLAAWLNIGRRCVVVLLYLFALLPLVTFVNAQDAGAPCGIVDSIDMPITGLVPGYDDFARFRGRFGGLHTGLDIGFNRWGDPVAAAARGRVTYADVEGWGTEKGVVIIEHIFPDNSRVYSVYGHTEETETIKFPQVGQCVERGDIIAAIGWPSRGLPHLHYELRAFLPDDGGPGYVDNNPLRQGWYHPLDFTQTWRVRLNPAFIDYISFDLPPSLPPVTLDNGEYVIASGSNVAAFAPTGEAAWRITTDSAVTGLAALPENRVVVRTASGQTMGLFNGRFIALWTVTGPDVPFVTIGEAVVFITENGGLDAYDWLGTPLWSVGNNSPSPRVTHFEANAVEIAFGERGQDGVDWRLVDGNGRIQLETRFNTAPAMTHHSDGSWVAVDDGQLQRVAAGQRQLIADVDSSPQQLYALTVDITGNSYVFIGGRQRLVSVSPEGAVRWQVEYPGSFSPFTPLMDTGGGCLLYTLDADGMLHVFNAMDGTLLNQVALYPGGERTGHPTARVLTVDANERVQVSPGFLSMFTLDGRVLGGGASNCVVG